MRNIAGKHPFCVLIYMNTYIFHICFILFILLSISNIWFCMLDVIIGRHTWNCQIRTHIHTGYTHRHTHKNRKQERGNKKKEGGGWVFRGVEERGYWGGQDLILITLDRHECFSVFHHLQKDKQRKQRHSLKLGKKRRESSKRNYYIISPRVIIKAIIIFYLENIFWSRTDPSEIVLLKASTFVPITTRRVFACIVSPQDLNSLFRISNHTPMNFLFEIPIVPTTVHPSHFKIFG